MTIKSDEYTSDGLLKISIIENILQVEYKSIENDEEYIKAKKVKAFILKRIETPYSYYLSLKDKSLILSSIIFLVSCIFNICMLKYTSDYWYFLFNLFSCTYISYLYYLDNKAKINFYLIQKEIQSEIFVKVGDEILKYENQIKV